MPRISSHPSSPSPAGNSHADHSSSGSTGASPSASFDNALNNAAGQHTGASSSSSSHPGTGASGSPTQSFGQRPADYLADNTLTYGPGRPTSSNQQLPQAQPGTVVPGNQNIINYNIDQTAPGRAQITAFSAASGGRAAGSQGNSAYYLPYSTGGKTNSISVPSHPTANDPQMVLTPALSGCAFYGKPGEPGQTVFSHQSTALAAPNGNKPAPPPACVPEGAGGIDDSRYGSQAGNSPDGSLENPFKNAFSVASYNSGSRQWSIASQFQDMTVDPKNKDGPQTALTGGNVTPVPNAD